MAEEDRVRLAERLKRIKGLGGKHYQGLERWLRALPRRQLALLAIGVILFSLLLGAVLAILLNLYFPAPLPNANSGVPSNGGEPQAVSKTGILRQLSAPQDGIMFYLETSDGTRILLDIGDRFDPTFLQESYEGTVVTIEGTITAGTGGSEDILQVERIVITY